MVNELTLDQKRAIALANARARASIPEPAAVDENPYLKHNQQAGFSERLGTGLRTALKERALGIFQLGMEATGNTENDYYRASQDLAKQYNQQQEGTGAAGFIGEVAGDPLTYLPFGAVSKGMKGVNLLSKQAAKHLAKTGAATGAVFGGLAPTEGGEDRLNNTASAAAIGAALTPAVGVGIPAFFTNAGKGVANLTRGVTARHADDLNTAAEALRDKGSSSFQAMRNEGLLFSRPRTQAFMRKIVESLDSGGELVEGIDTSAIGVKKAVQNRMGDKNPIGLDDLYKWRRKIASGITTANRAGRGSDAELLTKTLDALDDMISGTQPIDVLGGKTDAIRLLEKGKTEWSQYKKFEQIADILDRADGSPSKVQRAVKTLLRKTGGRGYSPQEMTVLNEMAGGGLTDNALAGLSRFGFGTSWGANVGGSIGAGLGLAAGGLPAAATIAGAGTAARMLRSGLEKGKAEHLLRIIEAGGKIPEKEVLRLPPEVAKFIMSQGLTQKAVARAVEENQ